ncbi:uncharacterized protein LOC144371766 [Ictidomys tridecemlineatus]
MEGPGRVTSGAAAGSGGGGERWGRARSGTARGGRERRLRIPWTAFACPETGGWARTTAPVVPCKLQASGAPQGLVRVTSPSSGARSRTSALGRKRILLALLEIMASARSALGEQLPGPKSRGLGAAQGLAALAAWIPSPAPKVKEEKGL